MSTYLLAFVVGEYDYIEERDRNGVLIRVYTPLGKKELGRFALEVSLGYNILNLGSKKWSK
jgi:puromycin-sensitive aminopeptidase